MSLFISSSTFCAFGMIPAGEMVGPRKSASVAPVETFKGKA